MERLLIKDASNRTTGAFPLTLDVVVIGRQSSCDLVLSNVAVSREHAKITKTPEGWTIEDLQSRNGVWVGGKRISDKPVLLANQDSIQIGEATLVFASDDDRSRRHSKGSVHNQETLAWREGDFDLRSIKSQLSIDSHESSVYLDSDQTRFRTIQEYERELALLEERLRIMLDFARILGKAEDVVDLTPRFLKNLLRLFPQADSACVIAPIDEKNNGRPVWQLVSYLRRDASSREPFRVSRAIVRHVVSTRSAIVSDSALDDRRFDSSESIVSSKIYSVMAAPIYDTTNDKLFGVIQIDSRKSKRRFENDELKLLVAVANQVAVYWENQYYRDELVREKVASREMQVANQVQRGFLPSEPPKLENYKFFDFYRPAKFVGGDYFDYIPLSDGSLAIILGDVSGKGISASLLMAKLSSEARYGLALEKTRAAAMARLNRIFSENHWGDRFITLVMLILEPSSGVVRVFNAGHLYPIVSKTDGSVERIGEGFNSFPLGVVPDAEYPEFTYRLNEGESLAIMSDGLPDAMNSAEEAFGDERVGEALRNYDGLDVEKLGKGLIDAVHKHAQTTPQTDDQCLVIFSRLPNKTSIEEDQDIETPPSN